MEMNMKIANIRSGIASSQANIVRSLERALETARNTNARLQSELARAKGASGGTDAKYLLSEKQLADAKSELALARKTIADLEGKVRGLTKSLNEANSKNVYFKNKKSDAPAHTAAAV